jgi:DNA-binding SARP family transcriptional activator
MIADMSSVSSVELGVLGPLQVRRDGATVAIPGAKPRAILTMLGLHNGSVVSADTLIALLWGDEPPRTAAKALQTHISSLRRALGEGVVVTQGTGWALQGLEVDATRYRAAAKAGRDAAAAGDTSQAVARFEEALALWRGIPELPEGRRGTSEKTRWIEGHAALAEDRADALLATGRAAELIGELEGAVADAPLRERRWGQLMLALYRAGRQGEALGAYQRARALLAEELGVDPGPDLRRLEAAIVAQDATLETPAAQHVPAVTRAVTFLLTDIEGSTAAWEADADAMAVALARHDELIEQVVTSRGGRLIKTRGEGDATFSVFERPSAAATAAIDLQEAISGEPWALREPMRVRVALHTGEVEFRDGDYFGRAVNRAARLRSLAAGGQILCSGATAELVIDSLPDDVVLADLGTRELRNLARPERVFELRLQAADDRTEPAATEPPVQRPALPSVLAGPGPFVGRGRELAQLFSAWQTALAGATNAALIAGEPGVGKTRLAGEWSQQAYDQGALVIYGRCDEDLGAPYQPFAEALRSLVPCLGAGKLRGLRGVEALLTLVPGLTDVVPDLSAPTRADPDTERYALFDAVVAVLGVASRSAPVVLILDDLHWAAKPTLLLLRHLLRFGEQNRVQILGTYRSTDLDRSHPLAAMLADLHRDGTANRIQLGGLDESDVTAYVAEAGYDDEKLARALASVTGGNPFFLIEALRHVEESGGQWDPSTLPQGVREAVSRRLSRLPAETNKALAAAAVVGSRFALDLVEHVVGDDLVDAFDEACKAGIVIEEPGGRYRFNHALVRQSLLAELPSVRRMRLHQRIAATLEEQPGAQDEQGELLAELAHHYFECAWAGNAAKAVEYCRRAADQAMARLAYEGAADLYDRALHALEEIDDELPDRDEQVAALLIARCEALLAAGDVASAAGAVSQLQEATRGSGRLAAWAACFDAQLSMLTHPDRLDEAESAVSAAAEKLAELGDTAGEAKAHTVRAGCLARLGRIGDCEIALDEALTAARRAREHRRVNAVLANAPLAALWGPNPVPRAGGRCLDVVRLLRITTESPAVEATSTRCQAVLEAFRGRDAAARRMIDSARRTVTELGLRHALLEVEQFAGIVELIAGDPAAAEPHLRQAYNGFRRMGLDADTAETAALLGRTCLALDRADEADELCTESERLAGHALKGSIAWRILRAQLLSRGNAHDEARRVAEDAVSRAERTDALVDHGDACLSLATVLAAAGDARGARAAAERAAELYQRKGAAALADKASGVVGTANLPHASRIETGSVVPSNSCAVAGSRLVDAVNREAWDEATELLASSVSVESRRKIVGFAPVDVPASQWPHDMSRYLEAGMVRYRQTVLAVRGDRFALFRLELGTADLSSGAPQDEELQVAALDDDGHVALQLKFDVEDIDAALAELDAQYAAAAPIELTNACLLAGNQLVDAIDREAWDEVEQLFAPCVSVESRRKIVGFPRIELPSSQWPEEMKRYLRAGMVRHRPVVIAVRGERLALFRIDITTADLSSDAPQDAMLQVVGLDEGGRFALQVWFDLEDIDAATAELDAQYTLEQRLRPPQDHPCARAFRRVATAMERGAWDELEKIHPPHRFESRRKVIGFIHDSLSASDVRSMFENTPLRLRHTIIAARGERLALARFEVGAADDSPGAPHDEMFHLVALDEGGRVELEMLFDIEDLDAAMAELDAQHARLEQGPDNACVIAIRRLDDALNRDAWDDAEQQFGTEISAEDRRKIVGFPRAILSPHEWVRGLRKIRALGAWRLRRAVIAVRGERLALTRFIVGPGDGDAGAPCEELLQLFCLDDDGHIAMQITFDLDDLDAATAELDAVYALFEEGRQRTLRLQNTASQVSGRFLAHFAARDWDAMAEMTADDFSSDDRRRVVGAGVQLGRQVDIENMRAWADVGITNMTSDVIATRGDRLFLGRTQFLGREQLPDAFHSEVLGIVEIDAENRVMGRVVFDLDDFDAAMAELETRYLAGEAAPYARTWSVIAGTYAAVGRNEFPALTPDCVTIDHRRGTAFAPGELPAYIRAGWELGMDVRPYVAAVHRLSDRGAVCSCAAGGVSREGFDAEWRHLALSMVEGDRGNRCEFFDEADLDAALARFAELHPPKPRLDNVATRVCERLSACFMARDWDALGQTVAEDICTDDRRRVVGEGIRRGRDAVIAEVSALAKLGVVNATSEFIATRGSRLALRRFRTFGSQQRSEEFHVEVLDVLELDSDERVAARVVFDPNDFDTAITELDARYRAGEAAAHAHTWSLTTAAYAAINRHELAELTPDWVSIDHRRGASFATGDMVSYVHALWDDAPDIKVYIENVHRLSDRGAVVTQAARGTSQQGFEAEWREIGIAIFDGDLLSRYELFDEADLEAALARFEELHPQTPRLANAASRALGRFFANFGARDWAAIAASLTDDSFIEDRNHMVNAGFWGGRDAVIANLRALEEAGTNITSTVIATRGERLALTLMRSPSGDPRYGEFNSELLVVVEIDSDDRLAAQVVFNLDDRAAAIAELDARYLAGEAAVHAHAWSGITRAYASLNRLEIPATAPHFVDIDHRSLAAIGPGDLKAYLSATMSDAAYSHAYVETVHRLTDFGAVVCHAASGTSSGGFDAEWRMTAVFTVEDQLLSRCEIFDEADVDAALARLEELHPQPRRLENAASRVAERSLAQFAARNWDALADMLADEFFQDDRRRVVGAGIRHGRNAQMADMRAIADVWITNGTSTVIATRGERLVLIRTGYSDPKQGPEAFLTETLCIVEIDADERAIAAVSFDLEDFDAALEELDARYLVGEGAAHAQTWSLVTRDYAALNRRELPATTADWINIDHRRVVAVEVGDVGASVRSVFEILSQATIYVEAVHRLTDVGTVVTQVVNATSQHGFDAEWREISILTFENGRISRCEVFDEADLDAALAKFDQLSHPMPQLANAATQVAERFLASFAARDWVAMAMLVANDFESDDRRAVIGAGVRRGPDAVIAEMRANAELWITQGTLKFIATRGDRLALMHASFTGTDQGPQAFLTETLAVGEINAEERIVAIVTFDLDDLDDALEELDARYVAGEAGVHAASWSFVTRTTSAINRHEMPPTTPDSVMIDHRLRATLGTDDLTAYIRSAWDLTPDLRVFIESVHRLHDLGAVVTHVSCGASPEGFDAEWRQITLMTAEGGLGNRCEIFDEGDLDVAIARFEGLHPQPQLLDNAASRVAERFLACLVPRDWDAMAELLVDDFCGDDRRKVVGAGVRHGRDAEIADVQAIANLGLVNVMRTVVAIRGARLALLRCRFVFRDQGAEEFIGELFGIAEISTDNRMTAYVSFDLDDFEAAIAELDARYLAGEAAAYARTWSVIAGACASLNRRILPATTSDFVDIDHRPLSIGSGDLKTYLGAVLRDGAPNIIYFEAVHRLTDLGAVVTHTASGTSREGFYAEWRLTDIFTVEGDLLSRCEIFDDTDVAAALTRFDELQPQAPRLENAASRILTRYFGYFSARDWEAIADTLTDDSFVEDRNYMVNAGFWEGREAVIANLRALEEAGTHITFTVIATRGERLALVVMRSPSADLRYGEFDSELLIVVESDIDDRLARQAVFNCDDIDDAFADLDARYLAGEAAAHAHTWSVIAGIFAGMNRHELPNTTPNWANVDRRRVVGTLGGDLIATLRDTWDLTPEFAIQVEAVHRLADLGAVVTLVARGTSPDGFDAEWRIIQLLTVEGDLMDRSELFDEGDLDAALARFGELQAPRLENAASRVAERFLAQFATGGWDEMAEILADDFTNDDRRRVVGAGIRHGRDLEITDMRTIADLWATDVTSTIIATRGKYLVLIRLCFLGPQQGPENFVTELFTIVEINADEEVVNVVSFDFDDIDAAFEELDRRYLAGEAAAHTRTWSVIAEVCAMFNRHELPATDWRVMDHRPLVGEPLVTATAIMRSIWNLAPDFNQQIEAVHRLSAFGAVIAVKAYGTSTEGLVAEWRMIQLPVVDGDRLDRCEIFDESDLDAALARFDELSAE